MKSELAFDPNDYDYGAATHAIRSILTEWIEIDWFESADVNASDATELFRNYQRLAHMHVPELFPRDIELRTASGDRTAFASWCERVRTNTSWDWRFGALKKLSHEHAAACGWSIDAEIEHLPPGPPRPGDPFFVIAGANGTRIPIWNSIFPHPGGLDALPRDHFGEAARFYIRDAHNDALECMKWQFAESSAELNGNPFLPLLLCYGAGAYPFSLGPATAVLFRFDV